MQGLGWNSLVGTESQACGHTLTIPVLSPDKASEKHTSYLSQVIFNLLFSPENSTNSKLQVPPSITTPPKGFSSTGAILVLGSTHSAYCSFKRKKNNPNCTIITTPNHLSITPQMIIPTSSQLLTLRPLPAEDLAHSVSFRNNASPSRPPLYSCRKSQWICFSNTLHGNRYFWGKKYTKIFLKSVRHTASKKLKEH